MAYAAGMASSLKAGRHRGDGVSGHRENAVCSASAASACADRASSSSSNIEKKPWQPERGQSFEQRGDLVVHGHPPIIAPGAAGTWRTGR